MIFHGLVFVSCCLSSSFFFCLYSLVFSFSSPRLPMPYTQFFGLCSIQRITKEFIISCYVQVNRDNHILCYDCIFTCTCCLDIITYMHICTTHVYCMYYNSLSLSLLPPSLLFVSLGVKFQYSNSRSQLRHIEKQVLEDYLWELKVSCKRHWMSGHPGIVCVCVCEREREREITWCVM